MTEPTKHELIECLRDHVKYFDCEHEELDDSCCTCEAKRLIQRYEHTRTESDLFHTYIEKEARMEAI